MHLDIPKQVERDIRKANELGAYAYEMARQYMISLETRTAYRYRIDPLHGENLKGVWKLWTYNDGLSLRVYVLQVKDVLCLLGFDQHKQRNNMEKGLIRVLEARRRDCLKAHK